MHIDPWTLALQATNVLILIWLLKRFLYRPVMAAIDARRQAADDLLAQARREKEAAEAESASLKAQTDSFAAQTGHRRAEMLAAVENERAHLLAQAADEAAETRRAADAALAAARARTTVELEEKAGVLACSLAETLLRRLPPRPVTDAMFQALVERLQELPAEERRRLADHAPLRLITAAPLDEAERLRYGRALAEILPTTMTPEFAADPELIAGFEVEGAHVRIRNSWRGDLDALRSALRHGAP